MLEILKDGSRRAEARIAKLLGRHQTSSRVQPQVAAILRDVRLHGDAAVRRLTKRLDGVDLGRRPLVLSEREIEAGIRRLDSATLRALKTAHARIVRFHRMQREHGFERREHGMRLGMRVAPLERVGVYVPGGRASYPSTVLMNVVPAKVAGVRDITVVTPPSKSGLAPAVLAAARIAGADRIVRVGGAQAVAALAYGTASIPRVDKIVGPGNIYVATAKRLVFGLVDIDMIAGPSEVLILADRSANAAYVAADMLAQAEHDPMAAAICIAVDRRTAERVCAEVAAQLETLERRSIARSSIRAWGTVLVVENLQRAAELANRIAPEHLEVLVRNPRRMVPDLHNAGAIFLGPYSAESLGDYAAGPNHVLPTGGAARFSSPLGVYDFIKRTSIIEATRAGFDRLAPTVERLARSEGLEGHALAVTRRTGAGGS